GHAPRFVERDPRDDARMADVALYRGEPLGRQSADGLAREAIRAGHFLPHQQPEHVGPVEEARIFDLLVLADAVEAELFYELDVTPKRMIVRRGQSALLPIALVEYQPQLDRPAVE